MTKRGGAGNSHYKGLGSHSSFITAAVALILLIATVSPSQSQRRSCTDCHDTFKQRLKKSHVHDPVKEGCDSCHKRHGFAQKLVLTKGLPELCLDCHESVQQQMSEGIVHGALSEGGCTLCHEPHASNQEGLLRPTEKGSSLCTACHTDLADALSRQDGHSPFNKGDCAVCHEPHAAQLSGLLVAPEAELCASCHEGVADKHKMPGFDDFACVSCHDPHLSSKKVALSPTAHAPFAEGECESCHTLDGGEVDLADDFPPADLCEACHDDITSKVAGAESHFGSTDRTSGGASTCLECHDPHGGTRAALLTKSEDELCRSCHRSLPDQRGLQGPIHVPFANGECTTCHEPHGGGGTAHLVMDSQDLCASCHSGMVPGEAPASHEAMQDAECADCHSGHGTDNIALLSETVGETCSGCHEKALHAVTHPPYQTFTCDACHRNHSSETHLLTGTVTATCGQCHSGQIKALGAQFGHPPAKEEDCLQCHVPHGGEAKGLLVEAQASLCGDCHDTADLVAGAGSVDAGDNPTMLHKPVEDGECARCHDPHGSPLEGLLNRDKDQMCYTCHQEEKVAFAEGTVHAPLLNSECDKCHTPHGSAFDNLAVASEPVLCTQCHDFSKAPLQGSHKGFDVSSTRCSACHNPHNSVEPNLLNPVVHEPFADGDCETCHESASEPGVSVAVMNAVSETICLDCHDDKEEVTGHHQITDLACADCHEPHSSRFDALLQNPGRLCQRCHADVLEVAEGAIGAPRFHRPIEDGSCLDCHKLHEPVSSSGFLVANQQDLCARCHESVEKEAAFLSQHEPFKDGDCSECHATHVSTVERLLLVPKESLCQECHDLGEATMTKAHEPVPLTGSGCITCHDPHASEKANSALLYPVMHSPYEDRECDVCHDSSGKAMASFSVCADCHADDDDQYARVHTGGRAVEDAQATGVCLDCHSPHVGHDTMLRGSTEMETCMSCHNRKEFTRTNIHGALEEGCSACHNVHDNNTAELRTLSVNAVCEGCHESSKMHAHPLGEGYVDPRTNDAMTCLSCHEPHSSEHEHILTLDHRRDLCVQCHASGTMRVR